VSSLRERREAVVREHMESENDHDFDTTLATFDHPRYEIIPTGDVHDGPEEVMAFACPMIAIFEFEPEGEGIVCERVYFDSATILAQLAG
jgi:hypothetical protein